MKKIRVVVFCITAAVVIAAVPAAAYGSRNLVPRQREYGAGFADAEGTWCGRYAQTCYEAGLMDGKSSVGFDSAGTLTNAQITVISARLLSLLQGGGRTLLQAQEGEAWYQPAYDRLVKNGVLAKPEDRQSVLPSFESWQAESPATRELFVRLLGGALAAAEVTLPSVNSISNLPDVRPSTTRLPGIVSFYNAGILSGRDEYGTFDSDASLSRGEAAAMLARIVDPDQRLIFTLKPFDLCRDVLGLPPDTVLLYADGEPVTAELFGGQLVTSLVQWGEHSTQRAEQDAIRIWATYSQSYFTLAEKQGVNLTEQQLADARAAAKEGAGYFGETEAYELRLQEQSYLNSQLRSHYVEQYGDKAADLTCNNDLAATAKAIRVETAPALESLDLSAVLTRAMASPFALVV